MEDSTKSTETSQVLNWIVLSASFLLIIAAFVVSYICKDATWAMRFGVLIIVASAFVEYQLTRAVTRSMQKYFDDAEDKETGKKAYGLLGLALAVKPEKGSVAVKTVALITLSVGTILTGFGDLIVGLLLP